MTEVAALLERATTRPWAYAVHERGPWQIGTALGDDEKPLRGQIDDPDEATLVEFVCESADEQSVVDAELICRAVNEYEALLEVERVLEEATAFLGMPIGNSVGAQAQRAIIALAHARTGSGQS